MERVSPWHWPAALLVAGGVGLAIWFATRPRRAPDSRDAFQDPSTVSRIVAGALVLTAVVTVISLVSGVAERIFLLHAQAGLYPARMAEARNAWLVTIGFVQTGLYVVTALCVFVWTYRMNRNVRRLGARGMRFSPGWSIGSYFIPIVGLWKPYQAMCEIWCASRDPANWSSVVPTARLGWWWACLIAACTVGRLSNGMADGVESVDDRLVANLLTLISDSLIAPLCLLLLTIVRDIRAGQVAAAARTGVAGFAGGAGAS